MEISTFYDEEYIQSANYQSFRSIASYADGLKNGGRKIIYTVIENNINSEIKVSQLGSKVAELTEYLHGDDSLQSTIAGMAQNFVGSNNINLLQPEGNFGTRFVPKPSASRYIYTLKSKYLDILFHKEDSQILIDQDFEGKRIEPRFYVPILPMILVNGSEGIGNGFAQKIMPRDLKDVIKNIELMIAGKKPKKMTPGVRGYAGKIQQIEDGKIEIHGLLDITNSNTITITEIPFTYDLQSYLKVLNDLEEKKIIKTYTDKSEDDKFLFEIDCTREFTKTPIEELYTIFKLVKRLSENFTCIDENNAIVEFKDELELLNKFVALRLDYYTKRKSNILKRLESEESLLKSKLIFIEAVVAGEIIVNNKPKLDIEKQIAKVKTIKKVDGSYDFLLRMAIYSLSKDKISELKKDLEDNLAKQTELKLKSNKDLWTEDLQELKKINI